VSSVLLLLLLPAVATLPLLPTCANEVGRYPPPPIIRRARLLLLLLPLAAFTLTVARPSRLPSFSGSRLDASRGCSSRLLSLLLRRCAAVRSAASCDE
jgi:hypothetical protein